MAAAFDARLKALRGHPVVVNQWASWCSSCRFELPFFRAMVERFSDRVAFLGLDSQDERAAGEQFQREIPSGFASVFDGDATVARGLGEAKGDRRPSSSTATAGQRPANKWTT